MRFGNAALFRCCWRDPDGIPQFGLVAEEVEKVNSDLITRDEDGQPTTVRYDAVKCDAT